jgi:small subunit ribosomal protein S9
VDSATPTTPPSQQKKEKPPVLLGKKRAHLGTGRRKTATARVYITEGTGNISINGRPHDVYFTEHKDRNAVVGPLLLTDLRSRVDLVVKVSGGGFSGQAGAVSQGVARALKSMFGLTTTAPTPAPAAAEAAAGAPPAEGAAPPPEDTIGTMAKKLRDSGYLTRDGRMKERKKYGRKGARKSFQFSKR